MFIPYHDFEAPGFTYTHTKQNPHNLQRLQGWISYTYGSRNPIPTCTCVLGRNKSDRNQELQRFFKRQPIWKLNQHM